ncbi:MAG: hypothetical protein HYX21_02175 [Candidatus Yanofskybacteria bacterium]|nr:hypothetical protein [Candidatus Yanofskybacteria bacterium]
MKSLPACRRGRACANGWQDYQSVRCSNGRFGTINMVKVIQKDGKNIYQHEEEGMMLEDKIGIIGRSLRLLAGLLILFYLAYAFVSESFLLSVNFFFVAAVGLFLLISIYIFVHRISRKNNRINWLVSACLILIPVLLMYIFGGASGEGKVSALLFLGVSLIVAAIRSDFGCEVMSIPNLIFGKRSRFACLVFSPLDKMEKRHISRQKKLEDN